MSVYLKAAAGAVALFCASQANAASFVVSANYPATFTVDRTAFGFSFTAISSVATSFNMTLSAYDASMCSAVRPDQCVTGYDPNRSATLAFSSGPSAVTQTGTISLSTGAGPVRDIKLIFSTLSTIPITIDFTPRSAVITAIPEPTTWALMLAGFGMVGYALRRRARVAYA